MKNLNYIFLLLIAVSCRAQNPIVDLLDDDGSAITNTYYKDVNNLLNQFEGTYVYTNGTTSFKIVLVKKVQQYNGRYYEDLIIGEYQYIENGVEKVNTLSEINTVYNNQRKHSIDGNGIIGNNMRMWKCPECNVNEKRLFIGIKDISTNRFAYLFIRKIMVGNQEAIKIKISNVQSTMRLEGTPMPAAFSLPMGIYTLIKQ